ncbi:LppX_LprAFG lipoprotein [Nakamurella deserti]|uniref:LppX_LprAFG lipoprotein n=1 Tax=Nakamurella deserti TaxID=2164074 RepID=UPI000DBE47B9|nr:LppX_LprAFG lipoprotein [Nakamurella deserti]
MHVRARHRWLLATALTSILSITGCSSGSSPDGTGPSAAPTVAPSASELISRSATAMTAVSSAHFSLAVTGTLPDLVVQTGDGDLTSTGSAQGTASIRQFGQLVEVEFVVVDTALYLKAGTGGFTEVPAALAGQVYDPTAILDPERGVAAVLTSTTGLSAVTEADGSYTVSGTVPEKVAASLTPGITTDVAGTFVVDAASSRTSSVSFSTTGSDGQPATVTLQLGDFDKDLAITAPAVS